jgi:hypothetical protein
VERPFSYNGNAYISRWIFSKLRTLEKSGKNHILKNMSIPFVNFFKNKDHKTSLEKALKLGLITQEEKLRLEADRASRRLDKFLTKSQKKRKP